MVVFRYKKFTTDIVVTFNDPIFIKYDIIFSSSYGVFLAVFPRHPLPGQCAGHDTHFAVPVLVSCKNRKKHSFITIELS